MDALKIASTSRSGSGTGEDSGSGSGAPGGDSATGKGDTNKILTRGGDDYSGWNLFAQALDR